MKKILNKSIIFFIIFFLFTNLSNSSDDEDIYKKIDLFSEVLDKINKEYVEEVNQSDAMDAAINGVLHSLDPYSSYMSPQLYKSMQTETSGEFGGLGIEVGMEAGVIKVISPLDNSPAAEVGVKAGDYIVKINDIQVQGKSLSEAVDIMRGPVGSDIEITIRRRGEKKALIFNITREIIKVSSVKARIIDAKTGYIRLTSFNENSSKQIKDKIKEFKKKKEVKIIFWI
jgi:Periplasmic protease